jgi:hypothetical protein
MKSPRVIGSGRGERGQALAEFAIVLPLILFFLAAILEFARAWNIKQAVTDAAREGARYVVVMNPAMTQDSVIAKVKERLSLASIDTSTVTITSADPACSPISDCYHQPAGYGREMTVTVTTPYRMGRCTGHGDDRQQRHHAERVARALLKRSPDRTSLAPGVTELSECLHEKKTALVHAPPGSHLRGGGGAPGVAVPPGTHDTADGGGAQASKYRVDCAQSSGGSCAHRT